MTSITSQYIYHSYAKLDYILIYNFYYYLSIQRVRSECPKVEGKLCNCTLDNLVWSPNREYLAPVITVNCSRLNLTSLPASLPPNTTTLLLIGNKVGIQLF